MPTDSISVVIIDPQSYRNLASYDFNLLSNLPLSKKVLIGNCNYEYGNQSVFSFHPYFEYSTKKIGLMKLFKFIQGYCRTVFWIFKNKPDIVHFQWFKLPIVDIIAILLIRRCSKTVITAHNVLPHDTGKKYFYFYKCLYQIVSGIIVHNEATKNEITSLFLINNKKIYVIKHGRINLKVDVMEKEKIKLCYRSLINKKKGDIVFSFLGNLTEYKGLSVFVNSVFWNNFSNNIIFVIAGKNHTGLKLAISEKSNLYYYDKNLSNEEYEALLELSDVIVMPYVKISQSGLLLSCIDKKIPVIISKQPGLLEPFEYGDIGWILDSNEPADLAKLIKQIAENRNYNFDWEPVQKAYSWPSIGIKTKMCYEKMLKE